MPINNNHKFPLSERFVKFTYLIGRLDASTRAYCEKYNPFVVVLVNRLERRENLAQVIAIDAVLRLENCQAAVLVQTVALENLSDLLGEAVLDRLLACRLQKDRPSCRLFGSPRWCSRLRHPRARLGNVVEEFVHKRIDRHDAVALAYMSQFDPQQLGCRRSASPPRPTSPPRPFAPRQFSGHSQEWLCY